MFLLVSVLVMSVLVVLALPVGCSPEEPKPVQKGPAVVLPGRLLKYAETNDGFSTTTVYQLVDSNGSHLGFVVRAGTNQGVSAFR